MAVNTAGFNAWADPMASSQYPDFAALDACGYPSPDTAGVPAGTSLTNAANASLPAGDSFSNGELYIGSTAPVSNLDVQGYVVLGVSGATLTHDLIECNDCNQGEGIIAPQGNSFTITYSTIGGTDSGIGPGSGGDDCTSPASQDVGPSNGGGTLDHDVLVCSGGPVNGSGYTLTNSYLMLDGYLSGSHNEDLYQPGGGSNDIQHNTLLDPLSSTAVIFMDEKNGTMGPTTIKNNLVSGAGYGDGAITGGGPNVTVENNRFSSAYGSNDAGSVCSSTTWSGNYTDGTDATVAQPTTSC